VLWRNNLGKVGLFQTQEQQRLFEAKINPVTAHKMDDRELSLFL